MKVDCEGCAGCCVDWRGLLDDGTGEASVAGDGADGEGAGAAAGADHERRGPHEPLDDAYNLVPLTRDEVRGFLESGLADALTPRLWRARGASGNDADARGDEAAAAPPGAVEIDGRHVAAIAGRPAFFVGPRKPPKPVAPFGADPAWLPTCAFLDPTTLQCRIHGDDLYPSECRDYPGHNLALEAQTECERVEAAFGGRRLLDDDGAAYGDLLLGPQAVGAKVFCHPRPADLEGVVERIATGRLTREDRAEFVAVAAASSPGTLAISEHHYDRYRERALDASSWAGRAIEAWRDRARGESAETPDPSVAERVEDDRGAPGTPGWDAIDGDGTE